MQVQTESARFTRNGFSIKRAKVYPAKIGLLKTIGSRPLLSEPSSATVIKDSAERYFLSFAVEVNPPQYPDDGEFVGIDLGISTFATLSTRKKIDAPKPLKKHLKVSPQHWLHRWFERLGSTRRQIGDSSANNSSKTSSVKPFA